MNVEQARKNLYVAEQNRKDAERNAKHYNELVNSAVEAEKCSRRHFELLIANEPTEDKIIDMSHFIDSGLLMRFSDYTDSVGRLAYLQNILSQDEYKYRNSNDALYRRCTPQFNKDYASMEGWDKPPIPEGYVIKLVYFGDPTIFTTADYTTVIWENVRMFRITAIKDGFKHE